jgi:hypothetical protein
MDTHVSSVATSVLRLDKYAVRKREEKQVENSISEGGKMIDWYEFWTSGPIRRFIYHHVKCVIRFFDNFWDNLE